MILHPVSCDCRPFTKTPVPNPVSFHTIKYGSDTEKKNVPYNEPPKYYAKKKELKDLTLLLSKKLRV